MPKDVPFHSKFSFMSWLVTLGEKPPFGFKSTGSSLRRNQPWPILSGSNPMIGATTEEQIRVRYGETDMMGHAYYGNYMLWFEQARGAWCRARGFTYKSLEERGYKLPVVEMWVKYRGEIKYDDEIIVRITATEIRRASIKFEYEIYNQTTEAVTTQGFTWHVLIGEHHKAVSIPPFVLEEMNRPPQT